MREVVAHGDDADIVISPQLAPRCLHSLGFVGRDHCIEPLACGVKQIAAYLKIACVRPKNDAALSALHETEEIVVALYFRRKLSAGI